MQEKKVVIYDSRHQGHHLQYVAYITSAFVNEGYKVVFVTHPDTLQSVEYGQYLKPVEENFEVHFVVFKNRPKIDIIRTIMESFNIVLAAIQIKPQRVFLPWLDPSFYILGTLGMLFIPWMRGRIEGILFRGDYAYEDKHLSFKQKLRQTLVSRIIRIGFFSRILFLDILAFKYHQKVDRDLSDRISFCPECVEQHDFDTDEASFRQAYGISDDSKVLGCFGVLDERKGIDRIIEIFVKYAPKQGNYLLLMGKTSAGVAKIINALHDPRIIVIDRFVSDQELLTGFEVSNVVAVPYPKHVGSSQILIRAAAAKKPVLASDYGVIAYITTRYKLGITVRISDDKEMRQAIDWSFNHPVCDLVLASELANCNTVYQFKQVIAGQNKTKREF